MRDKPRHSLTNESGADIYLDRVAGVLSTPCSGHTSALFLLIRKSILQSHHDQTEHHYIPPPGTELSKVVSRRIEFQVKHRQHFLFTQTTTRTVKLQGRRWWRWQHFRCTFFHEILIFPQKPNPRGFSPSLHMGKWIVETILTYNHVSVVTLV